MKQRDCSYGTFTMPSNAGTLQFQSFKSRDGLQISSSISTKNFTEVWRVNNFTGEKLTTSPTEIVEKSLLFNTSTNKDIYIKAGQSEK